MSFTASLKMYLILLTAAVISRFLPHPANFIPIGAIVIYASKNRGIKLAALLALAAMLISDIYIGFSRVTPYVYAGFLIYALAGRIISKKLVSYPVASVTGSIGFFVISNFGVWLGPWYQHNLSGLIKCYTLALPFFRNTLLGDLTYTFAIFTIVYLVERYYLKGGSIWQRRYLWPSLTKK